MLRMYDDNLISFDIKVITLLIIFASNIYYFNKIQISFFCLEPGSCDSD
jgi:hypothetical protein